jgi:hypothetical protein
MTSSPTASEASRSTARLRRGRAGRRLFALLVAAFVLAGALGVFGERLDVATAADDGYELAVEYPRRTRGGMSQDLDIRVRRAGGFDGPVTIALSVDYLRVFEQPGIQPEPAGATATADQVRWTFDPPPGDTLRVLVDLRVEPHRHWGKTGVLALVEGDREIVSVTLETVVMP